MTNYTNTRIIAYWNMTFTKPGAPHQGQVVVYSHRYGSGTVVNTGVFGTDLIGFDQQMQFLVYSSLLTP